MKRTALVVGALALLALTVGIVKPTKDKSGYIRYGIYGGGGGPAWDYAIAPEGPIATVQPVPEPACIGCLGGFLLLAVAIVKRKLKKTSVLNKPLTNKP